MTFDRKMRANAVCAVLAGLALRIFLVARFPVSDSGDSPFYIQLATNWLRNGIYGFPIHGLLTPVDMRVPGYPALIAAVFAVGGNSPRSIMAAQILVDLATCVVIALIAARLAPPSLRRRVAIAALWIAALCPFTANYTAVVLTETLTIFLTALATLVLLETDLLSNAVLDSWSHTRRWFLAGIVVGFGTLVRPETPLLLFAAAIVLLIKCWRPSNRPNLARIFLLLALGVALPILPWVARNWHTLHEWQPLAPRYSELPGEYAPLGFNAWTNTWLWRYRDVYLITWKLDDQEISMDDIPPSAFDSPEERDRVCNIFDQYNYTLTLSREQDEALGEIATERTRRYPLRTYLRIPLLRSLTLWFSPRVELLPFSGHLWPLRDEWQDDRKDFEVTLALVLANGIIIALAIAGAWIARRSPGWAFLLVFILLRTWFFTIFVETPEPRYVLECFPDVIALAAQVWSVRFSSLPPARDVWSDERSAESAP